MIAFFEGKGGPAKCFELLFYIPQRKDLLGSSVYLLAVEINGGDEDALMEVGDKDQSPKEDTELV